MRLGGYAIQNPLSSTASSTGVLPLAPFGVWFNSNNNNYYVATNPLFISGLTQSIVILSTTFSTTKTIYTPNNSAPASVIRGNTTSNVFIYKTSSANNTFYIYNASTYTLLGSFSPGVTYSSSYFDVDWVNNNIYIPYNLSGTSSTINVWSLGSTYSGPYSLQTTITYAQTSAVPNLLTIDSTYNRIITNGLNGRVAIIYLTSAGGVTQYNPTPQSSFLIVAIESNAGAATDVTFDTNYYYISNTNYGPIHIFRRSDFKYVKSLYVYQNTAGSGGYASFLYADSTLNKLHISYGTLANNYFPVIDVYNTDTTLSGI